MLYIIVSASGVQSEDSKLKKILSQYSGSRIWLFWRSISPKCEIWFLFCIGHACLNRVSVRSKIYISFFVYYMWVCVCVCALSHSVVLCSLKPYGLKPGRLLCPWNSPGKLEWIAMPSSRGSSQLRDRNCISYVSCIGR